MRRPAQWIKNNQIRLNAHDTDDIISTTAKQTLI